MPKKYMRTECMAPQVNIISIHSISSNRDSLIGTPLVSLEKYRDNSVFGGKNRGQAINKD